VEKRTFGKTGLEVSVLGFGGAPIGFLETEQAQVGRILNLMLDRGVNLIDTAAMYRGSEELIGATVGHRRDEYVLVSKCGQAYPDLPGAAWSETVILATVDRALKRLRTDHLDVMLLHSCGLDILQNGEALGALVKARDAGKIRFAGYSGDNDEAVFACGLEDVAVLQTSINLVDQANIKAALPAAIAANVGVMAKRPIANAAWKPLETQRGLYSSYARLYTERFQAMGLNPADLGFEGDPARVWPEIALRFTLSQPGVTTAIVGSTNPANVEANIEAASKGPLDAETLTVIRNAFARAEAASGEVWTGQT